MTPTGEVQTCTDGRWEYGWKRAKTTRMDGHMVPTDWRITKMTI